MRHFLSLLRAPTPCGKVLWYVGGSFACIILRAIVVPPYAEFDLPVSPVVRNDTVNDVFLCCQGLVVMNGLSVRRFDLHVPTDVMCGLVSTRVSSAACYGVVPHGYGVIVPTEVMCGLLYTRVSAAAFYGVALHR